MSRPTHHRHYQFVESLEERRLLATFTVNNVGDTGTGTGTTASRTLRQAINAANATTTADTIVFNLPRFVESDGSPRSFSRISPTSELPTIVQPVTIDGGDADGTQGVGLEINGSGAGANASGLIVNTGNCTLRDLAIVNFDAVGILVGTSTTLGNNLIARCHVGVDGDGVQAEGNGEQGIVVNTPNNTIGGLTDDDRNVIGGNGGDGILCTAGGNVILNSRVGVTYFGSAAIGNGGNGITLRSSNNRIGAATAAQGGAAARNVISGNTLDGVHIEQIAFISGGGSAYQFGANADNNVVAGNHIGTNLSGATAFANGGSGVRIINGDGNTIGAADAVGRNIISGNSARGVTVTAITYDSNTLGVSQNNLILGNYVGLSVSGAALGNGNGGVVLEENQNGLTAFVQNNRVGGTAAGEGNVIGANRFGGIAVQLNAGSTTIQGNLIGLDPTGTLARANGEGGVALNNSSNNLVGGPTAAARNAISGNTGDGIRIITTTTSSGSADFNTVTNNYIGTNAAGTAAVANTQYGVRIVGGSSNAIGDSRIDTGNAGNLISGNQVGGIGIGVSTPEFTERGTTNLNVVRNNLIGTNAAGTAVLTNNGPGIYADGSTAVPTTNTTLGGAGVGINRRGNVIVGTGSTGITLYLSASGTGVLGPSTLSVLGNYIGTTPAGTAKLGQLSDAMVVLAPNVNVGSTAAGGGNVFAGANGGITLAGAAYGATFVGNSIGTDVGGTIDLGNGRGFFVALGSSYEDQSVTIGGTTAAAANKIAFNRAEGVAVVSGAGIEIVGNRIYNNTGLGIDLGGGGVTLNDNLDTDTVVPNDYQNFPVIGSANINGTNVTVTASMVSGQPNTATRIDFYAVAAPDASGYGEGDAYLGSATVTTDSAGNASTTQTFSLSALPTATRISTTATRVADGSTSEFSLAATITDVTPPTAVSTAYIAPGNPPFLSVGFSENVGASLTASDFVIQNLTPTTPTTVPTANIALTYDSATNAAILKFPGYPRGVLPNGNYRVTLAAGAFADASGNANAAAYTATFFVLAGDANRDRVVDFNDFLVLQTNFGQSGRTFTQGDFNYDGTTDFNDFLILQTNFNATV